ncbi:hypothetical protein FOL47_001879 [Perkinsus chesapeaki]|uniref:Uncharacterized protein n=1 Tax=Perkinsus chesapeaki TaxID=330153 RepID=A0A7J6MHQ5_PERCH|nr:hypothetical protein FOL47_001879 [Perkinsus chesapeaki]
MKLRFYMFDWDDNILFMPTKVHVEIDGEPKDITTQEFAKLRGSPGLKPRNGSWEETFADMHDEHDLFYRDAVEAIEKGQFGPSYNSFKECLAHARLFAIITARGHPSAVLRRSILRLIPVILDEDEIKKMYKHLEWYGRLHGSKPMSLEKYISLCEFATVSSNEFRDLYGNLPSEDAKQIAMRKFIDSSVERIQRIISRNEALDSGEELSEADDPLRCPRTQRSDSVASEARHLRMLRRKGSKIMCNMSYADLTFGMSDDDHHNVQAISDFLANDMTMAHKHAKFYVYDTGNTAKVKKFMYVQDDGVVRKMSEEESEISEPGSSSDEDD